MPGAEARNPSKALIPDAATKRRRALWSLLLLLLLLGGGAGIFAALRYGGFTANPRLELRHIRLQSRGYWETPGREDELAKQLKLVYGTKLFALDPAELAIQLRQIPCVKQARVIRVLPDTLQFELVERTPRAVLFSPQGRWVIDEDAVLMEKRRSEAVKLNALPVLMLPRDNPRWQGGEVLAEARPALELLMTVLSSFPNLTIHLIDASNPDSDTMQVYLTFLNYPNKYCVTIPRDSRRCSQLLYMLQSAIVNAKKHGDQRRNYDLSFNGQVVIK